jgi:hypothetical protein
MSSILPGQEADGSQLALPNPDQLLTQRTIGERSSLAADAGGGRNPIFAQRSFGKNLNGRAIFSSQAGREHPASALLEDLRLVAFNSLRHGFHPRHARTPHPSGKFNLRLQGRRTNPMLNVCKPQVCDGAHHRHRSDSDLSEQAGRSRHVERERIRPHEVRGLK